MTIVTLTLNPTIDTSTAIDKVVPERKLRCDEPRHEPGGGGINVARAVHKLGGEALAVYPSGGFNGKQLTQLLEEAGVQSRPIEIDAITRENLTVAETSSDQQFRFVMPGPELSKENWQACLDVFDNLDPTPEYVVASGSLPRGVPDDFYGRLAERLGQNDVKVIVDTSGAALEAVIEAPVYLIKPNVRELTDMMGIDSEDEADIEEAAHDLLGKCGCSNMVVSLGRGGALLVTGDSKTHFRAPTVQIESKVGAGDSMVAGIVLKLARGGNIEEAVRYGVAAGTSAVTTPGSELCRADSTERLYEMIQQ